MNRTVLRPLATMLLAAMFLAPLALADEEARTWTDASGKFQVTATFVKFEGGKVHLLLGDGRSIALSSGQLSKADQQFVRELLAARRNQPEAETTEVAAAAGDAGEWLAWRGPNGNGTAAEGPAPVTSWSETENILWRTPVPGRGHSSPTIVGNLIVLTTANEQNQSQAVVAFDRATGKQLWLTEVNRGGFAPKIHNKNTHATPTVASDGEKLFAAFNNHGKAQLTALDLTGKRLWQTDAGPFVPQKYEFGYAPSPLVYERLVITCADFEQGWLAAFDKASGKEVWRTQRPRNPSYSSPIVANLAGRDQLLLTGAEQVASYDPKTGRLNWTTSVLAPATCGTVVWDEGVIYASGGYPKPETAAVAADGSGRVLWTNNEKCYEQSLLVTGGYVYAVNDKGIAFCWRAHDGEEMWKTRLVGGEVSASPTLAGGNIYQVNERGTVYVYKATPDGYQELAKNQLGDEAFASPTIVDGKIYIRYADRSSGPREEYLVCIGES